jgi:hypothetical protein
MSTSTEKAASERSIVHEPAFIRRPLDHCPSCNSWQLQPVVAIEAGTVQFLCGSCNRCWHVELGFVSRVNPTVCDGCPQTERCTAVYASDHTSA